MILVNGSASNEIDPSDRGLAYGDGVFRTLRMQDGCPVWWHDHYAKLAADCAALMLDCPAEPLLYDEVCRAAQSGDGVVKIVVTRGPGTRGYALPSRQPVTRVVASAALPPHAAASAPIEIAARWCDLRLGHQPRLAGIKHLNRLENVLARAEWSDPAIIEGVLRDEEDRVIGGVMSNLFVARDGTLFTPDLGQCGVAGVARARVMRAAERLAVPVRIEHLSSAAILAADELVVCNSVMGVRRVARLADRNWVPAGWAERLKTALDDDGN